MHYLYIMSMMQVNLMHIFLVGPLLWTVGDDAPNTANWKYNALGAATLMIPFIVRLPGLAMTKLNVINWFHYLIFFSLFLYVSYYKNKTNIYILRLVKLLGIAVVLIHSYLLMQRLRGLR